MKVALIELENVEPVTSPLRDSDKLVFRSRRRLREREVRGHVFFGEDLQDYKM